LALMTLASATDWFCRMEIIMDENNRVNVIMELSKEHKMVEKKANHYRHFYRRYLIIDKVNRRLYSAKQRTCKRHKLFEKSEWKYELKVYLKKTMV